MFCKCNFHNFFKEDLNIFFSFFFNCTLGFQSQKSLTSIWNIQLIINEKDQVNKKLNKLEYEIKRKKSYGKKIHIL